MCLIRTVTMILIGLLIFLIIDAVGFFIYSEATTFIRHAVFSLVLYFNFPISILKTEFHVLVKYILFIHSSMDQHFIISKI